MRHRKSNRRFDRTSNQRKALFRSLANSLILHDRITTTLAKARAIRPKVERLVTLARTDDQHRRRLAFSKLVRKESVTRLFNEVAPRVNKAERPGGYTRILKLGARQGDGAEMAILEFVDR